GVLGRRRTPGDSSRRHVHDPRRGASWLPGDPAGGAPRGVLPAAPGVSPVRRLSSAVAKTVLPLRSGAAPDHPSPPIRAIPLTWDRRSAQQETIATPQQSL